MKSAFLSAVIIGSLLGCNTTKSPRNDENLLLEPDEARIWERSREAIEIIRKSGVIIEDDAATEYLQDICRKLYPDVDKSPSEFEVLILRDPTVNAFVFPNGVMCVHSGLLAAMESEAQVAMVLAHELAHFHQRHSIHSFRHLKNQAAFHTAFSVGTLGYGSIISMIGLPAAISGHSKAAENEADSIGWKWYLNSGYAPEEATESFRQIKVYIEETKGKEPYFFGSHPRLQERIDRITKLVAENSSQHLSDGKVGVTQLNRNSRNVLLLNASIDMEFGNLERVQRLLDRFDLELSENRTPDVYAAKADLMRRLDPIANRDLIIDFCENGLEMDPLNSELRRILGRTYYECGDYAKAIIPLRESIDLDPEFPRNPFIKHYLKQCEIELNQ